MVMTVYDNVIIIIIVIVIYLGKCLCCDIGNSVTRAFKNLANKIYKFH